MTRRPRPCPRLSPWPRSRAGGWSGQPLSLADATRPSWRFPTPRLARPLLALAAAALLLPPGAAHAGIRFENCVQGSDGSISCDTVPTGNTYLNDKDAQYGLLQQASPGWAEFNPYQGYDEDFGGGDD